MTTAASPALSKADDTRTRILEAALHLFRERGFEQTTMRDIAKGAGVASGAAYYYFDAKEALVMAFYERAKDEMDAPIKDALSRPKTLAARVQAVLEAKFTYFAPNRKFLGALFRHAADPANPLSPFSAETRAIREHDIAHFAQAVAGSNAKAPVDLQPHLPRLLWLYQMGLILFWIYDRSPGQVRTRQLAHGSVHLIARLLQLARLPLLQPVRKSVIELIQIATGEER